MRKRNKNYLNNVGELITEISNQDMEMVNGGRDIQLTIINPIEELLKTKKEVCQNITATTHCGCTMLTVTKKCNCSAFDKN